MWADLLENKNLLDNNIGKYRQLIKIIEESLQLLIVYQKLNENNQIVK